MLERNLQKNQDAHSDLLELLEDEIDGWCSPEFPKGCILSDDLK